MTAPVKVAAIAPVIKVNGQELQAETLLQLVSVRVRRGLRLPGRTELSFDDPGMKISGGSTFTLGTEVEITMSDGTQLFLGEVTGIDVELHEGLPIYTVVADDIAHRFTTGRAARTFAKVKVSDVVSKICAERGVQVDVDATTVVLEHLTQAGTDFDFLCELADRTGMDWWVKGNKVQFRKVAVAPAVATLRHGDNLFQLSVRATALHPGDVTTTGWDPATKREIVAVGKPVQDALPSAPAVTPFVEAADLKNASKVRAVVGVTTSNDEAKLLADAAAADHRRGAVVARGTGPVEPKIVPGCAVSVQEAGPLNGTYHVTEVEHLYSDRGFLTKFVAGPRRPTSLVDRFGPGPTSSLRTDGAVVGIVTNNKSSPLGKVKVKFPGIDDQVESDWARVVTPGAGKDRGLLFLPEVNDEVIVIFEGGDIRRPLVLGGVHNGKDPVPSGVEIKAGLVQQRTLVSRSGHSITFGDGDARAEGFIGLTLKNGNEVKLAGDKLSASVAGGTPVEIVAGNARIEITDKGDITLQGVNITLKATNKLELSGATIQSKATATSETSGQMVTVKSNSLLELSGSATTMVKGGTVLIN